MLATGWLGMPGLAEELPGLWGALEEIRRERVRGAAWAAYRAAVGLLDDVEAGRDPCRLAGEAANAIEAANPSMASLANVAHILRLSCERGSAEGSLRNLVGLLSRYREELIEAARSVSIGGLVVTISYSSSVEAALRAWRGEVEVVVAQSLPGGEGVELARLLRSGGFPVRVAPDLTLHLYLDRASLLVFGADTVTRDGCIVNKVGTRLLAEAARSRGVKTLVVFEPYKVHPRLTCGRVPVERWTWRIQGWGDEVVPVFDETPPELVTAALTPRGLVEWGRKAEAEAEKIHRDFVERVLEG